MAPVHTAACVSFPVIFALLLGYSSPWFINVHKISVNSYRQSSCSSILSASSRFSDVRSLNLTCVVPAACLPAIRPVTDYRRRKFASSRTVYCNSDATFNIQLNSLLLLSGDVHTNPGPTTSDTSASHRRPSTFIEHGDGHLAGSGARLGLRTPGGPGPCHTGLQSRLPVIVATQYIFGQCSHQFERSEVSWTIPSTSTER